MTETQSNLGGGDGPGPGGRIEPIELQTSMQRAADVRDGLKPVHRRVLYAMYDGGYRPDRGFSKCSRVVGDAREHFEKPRSGR